MYCLFEEHIFAVWLKRFFKKSLHRVLPVPPIVDAVFAGKAPWTLSLTKLNTTLPYSCNFSVLHEKKTPVRTCENTFLTGVLYLAIATGSNLNKAHSIGNCNRVVGLRNQFLFTDYLQKMNCQEQKMTSKSLWDQPEPFAGHQNFPN